MRLLRTTISGIGPFHDTVSLDASALPGVLTAVVGANGSGKSTLCAAAILGALYRRIPRVGAAPPKPLHDIAVRSGAYIESTIDCGDDLGVLTFRQIASCDDERGESLVLDARGRPIDVLQSTGVRAYSRWAATALPAYDVVCASSYMPQQTTGLLHMTRGDRMAVVLRAIGAERLERLARAAADKGGVAETRLREHVAMIGATRDGAADPAVTAASVARAAADVITARAATVAASVTLADARHMARLREAVGDSEQRLAALRGQVDAAQEVASTRAAVDTDSADAKRLRAMVQADTDAAEVATRVAERAAEDATVATNRRNEATRRIAASHARYGADRERLTAAVASCRARIADADKRIAANRDLIPRAAEIRDAVTRLGAIDASLVVVREDIATAQAQFVAATREIETQRRIEAGAAVTARTAAACAATLTYRLRDADAVAAAVEGLRAAVIVKDQTWLRALNAEETAATLRRTFAGSWEQRHHDLRAALVRIDEWGPDAWHAARIAIEVDDGAARMDAELPCRIDAADGALTIARAAAKLAEETTRTLEALAARADGVQEDRAALDAATAEERAAVVAGITARENAESADATARMLRAAMDAAGAELAGLQAERVHVRDVAKLEAPLDAAAQRIADLEAARAITVDDMALAERDVAALPDREAAECADDRADVDTSTEAVAVARETERWHRQVAQDATGRATASRAALAAIGDIEGKAAAIARADAVLATLAPQIGEARRDVDRARVAIDTLRCLGEPPTVTDAVTMHAACADVEREAVAAAAVATEQHRAAVAAASRVSALSVRRRATEEELHDYRVLSGDLGRNGIQADLIDAAAPELTESATDLLRASVGPRWAVRFDSTRDLADGRTVDGFAIRVLDTETGRDDDAADWCGGETALIGNAVADAVAILACKRGRIEAPTLVRDEAAAALDAHNEAAWVQMLRRTASIVRASRVFVVTHSERVRSMCDGAIEVANGSIRVVDR